MIRHTRSNPCERVGKGARVVRGELERFGEVGGGNARGWEGGFEGWEGGVGVGKY